MHVFFSFIYKQMFLIVYIYILFLIVLIFLRHRNVKIWGVNIITFVLEVFLFVHKE